MANSIVASNQAISQYSVGLFIGFVTDSLCDRIPYTRDDIGPRIARQLIQLGINGAVLAYYTMYLQQEFESLGRDPTGGYFLGIGLIHGQPSFQKNTRGLIKGLKTSVRRAATADDYGLPDQNQQ